jgi:SAM-dependent methyltransferase
MSSAMTLTLRDRYLAVKTRRQWHSWPVIRHWRTLRYRRLQPVDGGKSSGLSTIRYYWADFLEQNRADIRGHVLEIGETATVRAFGGEAITQADALDLAPHSPEVRVVADLSRADHVPGEVYDCFVNQFTTCVIYDIDAALYHAIRLLKPGGVLLINFWCLDFYLHRGLDMGSTCIIGSPPSMCMIDCGVWAWAKPIINCRSTAICSPASPFCSTFQLKNIPSAN